MSRFAVSIRFIGRETLGQMDQIIEALSGSELRVLRRGEKIPGNRIQPSDVVVLKLAGWAQHYEHSNSQSGDEENWLAVAQLLNQLIPKLAFLDRSECGVDLYISAIREEDQGGLGLPVPLIRAAAELKLPIEISIPVMFDDYDHEVDPLRSVEDGALG